VLAACAAPAEISELEQGLGAHAKVKLDHASSSIAQTATTSWSLVKTGSVDAPMHTLKWTIAATSSSTPSHHLTVKAHLAVRNDGNASATLGNAVLALTDHHGQLLSADVADASHGDAATSVLVADGSVATISENAASGTLTFADAQTGAPFSLVPEPTLAPHQTLDLIATAEFDNDVLDLAVGTQIRVAALLSFGNAGGNVEHGVDINGNGTIDPDEASVTSVGSKLQLEVPAATATAASPVLSDTLADITATGTVTFSNAHFQLGATTGTVSVTYRGGASGGTLGNCAHLTTSDGSVNLTACDVETIAPEGWTAGAVVTYTQADWGGDPSTSTAAAQLDAHYDSVFAPTSGILDVGIPGTSGFSMQFLDALAVRTYLPASGAAGPLVADLLDPTSSPAGAFGGDAVALRLNIAFSDAGVTTGSSGLHFGDLTLCGMTTLPALEGTSVRGFATLAETLLGGGSGIYTISDIEGLLTTLDAAFEGGTPSAFAQQNLVAGPCP
jgi:hypothetical protein